MATKEELLNKYKEMYKDYISKVCEVHNAHMYYLESPNRVRSKRLKFAINAVKNACTPMKASLDATKKEIIRIQAEEKRVREQKKAEKAAKKLTQGN